MTAKESSARSQPACAQCRARKVRCTSDGIDTQPCRGCRRLGFACSKMPGSRSTDAGDRPVIQRKRVGKACRSCHDIKSKCSGEVPCQRCRNMMIVCEYSRSRRQSRRPLHQQASASAEDISNPDSRPQNDTEVQINDVSHDCQSNVAVDDDASTGCRDAETGGRPDEIDLGLDRKIVQQLIDAFFNHLYPTSFLSFLHRGLFLRAWYAQTLDPTLLKVVCACSSKYVSEDFGASTWVDEAETEVLRDMGDMSTVRLQVMLLLIYYHGSHRSSKAWMLSALATRLAYAKRFNYEQDSLPETTRESQRRLMWSLFIVDRLYSGGLREFTLCPKETFHIRLPCNERLFTLGIPSKLPKLDASDGHESMGVLSCYIRLLDIRHDILNYTKSVIMEDVGLWDSRLQLRDLETRLSDFAESLPPEMRWTSDNLLLRAYTPNLTRFIMLHAFLHQGYCDLYRLPIRGIKESVSDRVLSRTPQDYAMLLQDRCLDSAFDLARMFSQDLELGLDDPVKDLGISACAYQCAKIVAICMHDGLSSVAAQSMRPGDVVNHCLGILENLRYVYPMAEAVYNDISRIQALIKDLTRLGSLGLSISLQDTTRHPVMSRHSLLAHAQEETAKSSEEGASAHTTNEPQLECPASVVQHNKATESLIPVDMMSFNSLWGLAPISGGPSNDPFGGFDVSLPF